MDSLVLYKGGIIAIKEWKYNEIKKKGKYVYTKIAPTKRKKFDMFLLSLLRETIELRKDFTVRDWFKLVLNYPIYQKLDPYIKYYIKEYKKCPINNCVDLEEEIDCINFEISIELEKDKTDILDCSIYTDIHGTGLGLGNVEKYAIELTPLNQYLDLPIKIINGAICRNDRNKISDYKIEKIKSYYNLFEFITSFIYEISFFGKPIERNKKLKEINKSVKEIKKEYNIENNDDKK